MRERKGVNLSGCGNKEDLEGIDGIEIMIRIYCMKKIKFQLIIKYKYKVK